MFEVGLAYIYGVDVGRLQRLLPLKRALTEIEHDVRDTHHALEQVGSMRIVWLNRPLRGYLKFLHFAEMKNAG